MKTAPTWFEYLEVKLLRSRPSAIKESDTIEIDLKSYPVRQIIEVEHSPMTDAQRLLFGMGMVSK